MSRWSIRSGLAFLRDALGVGALSGIDADTRGNRTDATLARSGSQSGDLRGDPATPERDPYLTAIEPDRCAAMLLDWLIEMAPGETLTFAQVRDRAADMVLWYQVAMSSEALLFRELALLLPGKHYESRGGRKVRIYRIPHAAEHAVEHQANETGYREAA